MTSVMTMALAEAMESSEKCREKLGKLKKCVQETFESKWFWIDFHISYTARGPCEHFSVWMRLRQNVQAADAQIAPLLVELTASTARGIVEEFAALLQESDGLFEILSNAVLKSG